MDEKYDCMNDVREHRKRVRFWICEFMWALLERAPLHDISKLSGKEKKMFDRWTPNLKDVEFGSQEYKQALSGMGIGLDIHYANNRHHPEHFKNGIDGMTLVDILEMVCDWMATAEAKGNPIDFDYLKERFKISDQMMAVFSNTMKSVEHKKEG